MRYTTTTLKKLEEIYGESGYSIRYGKGNFKSGHCILEDKKIVVINKLFSVDARINSLVEMISEIQIDEAALSEGLLEFYQKNIVTIVKEKS